MSDEAALLVADLYEAAGALRRLGERTAAAEGLTQARWQVMSVVAESPLTVPQAARRLGVSRQNVQRVAGDLVERDLAAFEPNPDHRGSPLLVLTGAGAEALGRVTVGAATAHRAVFGEIPGEDVHAAREFLRGLLTGLDRYEAEAGGAAGSTAEAQNR
ncbi:MarR family winged helix-turn-helix transcriptional regulator [Streptomyces sp. NPDC059597]|uniref:MarR family winged helix-turn-helix transcriptional regulator n=1 Tax=Streptomyces sp. NPDC059597 TaxID=3346879 RepID=UPI00367A2214